MCAHVLLIVVYAQVKQQMQTRLVPSRVTDLLIRVRVKGSEQNSLWLTIFELMSNYL